MELYGCLSVFGECDDREFFHFDKESDYSDVRADDNRWIPWVFGLRPGLRLLWWRGISSGFIRCVVRFFWG